MKLRYWILLGFVALVAIVVAGAAVLLETEAGLRVAASIAESHSGGALQIGAVHGKLAGPLTLERVRLTLPDAVIQVRHLELDWHPGSLAGRTLRVAWLHGEGVRITPRPGEGLSQGLPQQITLPLHIIVPEAHFRSIVVNTPANPLQLARLGFALDASSARIQLSKLLAQGPRAAFAGELRVDPYGDWPVHAALASTLDLQAYPPIAGRTRLDGTLRGKLELQQSLIKPFDARLDATVSALFDTPHLQGTLHIARLDPHTLDPAWPELQANADLGLAGTLERFHIKGKVDLAAPEPYAVNLDLGAGIDGKRIRIDHLDLALAGQSDRVALSGTVNAGETPSADLVLQWRDLTWPLLEPKPTVTAAAGEAHLKGNLDGWALAGKTLLQTGDLPQGSWTFGAHGDRKTLMFESLDGKWLGGTIAAQGSAELEGARPFRLTARVRNMQLHTLSKRFNGQAGFDLAASGKLEPLQARLQVTNLDGRLQGRRVKGNADLAYADDTINLRTLTLAVGVNRFDAEGRWGRSTNLKWRVQAPKLDEVAAGLGGSLDAHGTVTGARAAPRIKAELAGEKLHWNDLAVARAHVQADVDLATHTARMLDVHVEGLERGDLNITQLDAKLDGPPTSQHFLITVSGNEGDVRLAGSGRLDHGRWVGELAEGSLVPARGPRFDLAQPAALTFARNKMQLDKSCWRGSRDASFCLAAASGAKGWQASLDLQRLPLDLADPWLSGGQALAGEMDANFTATGGAGKLKVQAEAHTKQASISRSFAGKTESLKFDNVALNAQIDNVNAKASLVATLAGGGTLNLTADIPWRAHTEPAGQLHLVAHLRDLSGLGALSDAVSKVAGRLDADFTVSGSLDAPEFAGDIRLTQAAATLTQFGTQMQDGDIVLTGAGAGVRIEGKLKDGHGGGLDLNGDLERGANEWALAAQIEGKNFHAANMPEARVVVNPDLKLRIKGYDVALVGTVAVPTAQIKPPHFSEAITPTPDLVVIGEEQAQAGPPWQLSARLTVSLGDHVRFSGYGLDARVGGAITIHERPGKLTTATGELKIIDGEYKAYGQDLKIERGRLLFSGGPIANPGLDIRATRTVGLVTAGLAVGGTLRNPSLRVFSNPSMSQSDALAYLLFGHGMQQTSSSQQNTVNSAANAIGLAGGTYIVKSLGKHVGVDTVTVENASEYTNNANQASLFLGKYLNPRLYVSYGIGLYAPINLLRVRYTLSRHWALQAESGSISGADILFNIEY
ncbi:MAG: translocation/assembly module TamB domain-containing protein [Gammaproteobacteria bacterium]